MSMQDSTLFSISYDHKLAGFALSKEESIDLRFIKGLSRAKVVAILKLWYSFTEIKLP